MRPETLFRLVTALIAEEVGRIRQSTLTPDQWAQWSLDTRLEENSAVGIDSLALLDVVARVNQFFHLHEVGSEDYLFVRRSIGEWVDVIEQSLKMRSERLTFLTSGSTGTPKKVTHTRADLDEEVSYWAEQFKDRKRVLAYLPPHHIYGFIFSILLPERLELEVIDARIFPPSALAKRSQAGDLIVTTPVIWAHAARADQDFAPDTLGLSSSAPLDQKTWRALQEKGLSLSEIYGSSETAGLGWRSTPDAGFTPLPYWHFDQDQWLRGDTSYDAPDHIDWDDEGRFKPTGRRDGAVQVGGHNVFPRHISETLQNHTDVKEAVVRLSHDASDARLKAFIVPARDTQASTLEKSLRQYCESKLKSVECPAHYTFGPALPRNDMGKLTDWGA